MHVKFCKAGRPGGQPANLQGLWNDSNTPAWDSKYTDNINTEMNYWPAEMCNVSELHQPLFDLIDIARGPGHRTAQAYYGAGGFVIHHNTDLWGDAAPIDGVGSGIWPMGGAWLSLHLWDHYDFTRDRKIIFANRDYRQVDNRERLVRFQFERHFQVRFCGIKFSLVQLEAGKIDQHARGIATRRDRPFEKCALIFPIERSQTGPDSQKDQPKRQDRDEDPRWNPQAREGHGRSQEKKGGGEIKPVFGDRSVQRKNSAYGKVNNESENQAAEDFGSPPAASDQPVNRGGDQDYSKKSFELAPGHAGETRFIRAVGVRFDIAIHMKLDWK